MPWTNFIIRPIVLIWDGPASYRMFEIENIHREKCLITLPQDQVTTLDNFQKNIEGKGNYIIEAVVAKQQYTQLKKYIYEQTPTAREIQQLGWQKQGEFFAWGNGAFDGEVFIPANDYGLIKVGDKLYYLPAASKEAREDTTTYNLHRKFVFVQQSTVTLYEYARQCIDVFGENAKIALCFYFTTLFSDIVRATIENMPILDMFGPPATGKPKCARHRRSLSSQCRVDQPSERDTSLARRSDRRGIECRGSHRRVQGGHRPEESRISQRYMGQQRPE